MRGMTTHTPADPHPELQHGLGLLASNPTDPYDNLCGHWILRALLDLGGYRECLHESHCSAPHLMKFFIAWRELTEADKGFVTGYHLETVLSVMRGWRYLVMGVPLLLPEQTVAVVNLRWMQRQFGLSALQVRVLLLCLLARKHHPLGLAMETLGDLSTLRLLSVIAMLLDESPDAVAEALAADGALARSGLAVVDNSGHYLFPHKIDLLPGLAKRVFEHHDQPMALLQDHFAPSPAPRLTLASFGYLQPQLGYVVALLRDALKSGRRGVNVLVYGSPGAGKTALVRAVAAQVGASLHEIAAFSPKGKRLDSEMRLNAYALSQQVAVQQSNALVLFDDFEEAKSLWDYDDDAPVRSGARESTGLRRQLLSTNAVPGIWTTDRTRNFDAADLRQFEFHLQVRPPPAAVRAQLFMEHTQALNVCGRWARGAGQHADVGPALIERTARAAQAVLRQEPQARGEEVMESLLASSLKAMGTAPHFKAGGLAGIEYDPALVCTDVDVPALVNSLRAWPHARMCFHGVPGTGKSALATHIAEALGRPVILKRCSDLLGTYVGESERFVANAFEAARREDAVLIMDEADSFLSSRQHAQRQFELTLVNEFLQQMEAFDRGIFVATTNLMSRLDDATLRRFDLKVAFEYLRPAQAAEMMRRACTALGVYEPGCGQLVHGLVKLAPGDFHLVMRQARFRPVRGAADIRQRLVEEVDRKGGGRPIGFNCVMS